MGLLLLRVGVGLTVIFRSLAYFSDQRNLTVGTWTAAILGLASGACLLIGLFTPPAGVLVGLGGIGNVLGWVPAPAQELLNGNLALLNGFVMVTAVVLLGPGAFSLDAWLFGRREIVIPSTPHPPKS